MKSFFKSIFTVALIAALALCLVACGSPAPSPQPAETPAPAAEPATPAEPAAEAPAAAPEVEWPTKAITIYNSSTAGSPTDLMAREVGKHLEQRYGHPVNVINATGGSGAVMFGEVFSKESDGYILGSFTASQVATLQAGLEKDFPFENFEFICSVELEAYNIAIRGDAPFKTAEEFVQYGKDNPGALKISGQGTGSAMHLTALQFAKEADFTFVWLPTEGGSESRTSLLGGHCDAIVTSPSAIGEYIEAGQMINIANTGSQILDGVPTFESLGYNVPFTQYRGFFAKKGIDPAIAKKISDIVGEISREPEFVEFLAMQGLPDGYIPMEEFGPYAQASYDDLGLLSKELLGK